MPGTNNHEPLAKKTRFSTIATDENILDRILQNSPKSTRYKNEWAVNAWAAWALWRNTTFDATLSQDSYKIVPLNPHDATEHELGFWLSRFVIEVRNAKGKPYPPNTLHGLLCGIQRHCNTRSDGRCLNIKIFDKCNPNFYKFYHACDNVMRELTAQGYGQEVLKANIITPEDEEKLWSSGTINLRTPQGLLYKVYYYNVRAFGLRGGKIHRGLEKEQFKIVPFQS